MPPPLVQRAVFDPDGVKKGTREAKDAISSYTKQTKKEVTETETAFGGMGNTVKGVIGGVVATAFAFLSAKVLGLIGHIFNVGSAVGETASKFNTVFGGMTSSVQRWINENSRMFALTNTEARDFLSIAGAIAKGMGATEPEAAKLATAMGELAGDMQSFHNVPIGETFNAIRAGLTGEMEPMKRFGVIVKQDETELRAMADTGKTTAKELTQLEIATARLNLMMEKQPDVIGDAERTMDSAANQARILRRDMRQLGEDMSEGLIPAYEEVIAYGRELLGLYGDTAETLGQRVSSVMVKYVGELIDVAREAGRTAEAIGMLTSALNVFGTEWSSWTFILDSIEGTFRNLRKSIQYVTIAWYGAAEAATTYAAVLARIAGADDTAKALYAQASAANRARKEIIALMDEQDRADRMRKRQRELNAKDPVSTTGAAGGNDFILPPPPDGGGGGATDAQVRAAEALVRKLQEAAAIEAAMSDDEREALQEIFKRTESIADLKEKQKLADSEALRTQIAMEQDALRVAALRYDGIIRLQAKLKEAAGELEKMRVAASTGLFEHYGKKTPETFADNFDSEGYIKGDALVGMAEAERVVAAESKKTADNKEKAAKHAEKMRDALENAASSIRSMVQLVDAFGDLPEHTRKFADGIAGALDNFASLDKLARPDGTGSLMGGLKGLFSTGAGAASAILPTIGLVAGAATTVSGIVDFFKRDSKQREEEARKRREETRELVDALGDNAREVTDAIRSFTDAAFQGSGITGEQKGQVGSAYRTFQDAYRNPAGGATAGNVFMSFLDRLEHIIPDFDAQSFRDLFRSLEASGIVGQSAVDAVLNGSAPGMEVGLDALIQNWMNGGQFAESMNGLIEGADFFSQFLSDDLPEQFRFFMDFLLENIDGLKGNLKKLMQEAAGLDLTTDEGRARLKEIIGIIAAGMMNGTLNLGGLTPEEVKTLLENLDSFAAAAADSAGGDNEFTRSVQIARSITEIQANELIAISESMYGKLDLIEQHLRTGRAPAFMGESILGPVVRVNVEAVNPITPDFIRNVLRETENVLQQHARSGRPVLKGR